MAIPTNVGELAVGAGENALAFGLGFALGRVLEPVGTGLAQKAWAADPTRAPDAVTMAEGVAQGQVPMAQAADWAAQHGYGTEAFAALVNVANVGPALGAAYQAWRRGELSDAEFDTALLRTGLEPQWNKAMRALKDEPLELGELAKAVHRGIMAGAGLLVTSPSSTPGKVPFPAPSPIDPVEEASWLGITAERLRVAVGNAGLPPGIVQALELLNRGAITEDDFSRVVAESNLRNEYTEAMLELRRRILTPHDYVALNLRGWIEAAERDAGAALSGMTPEDADLLFKLGGRPLAVHQITTGLARGGKFEPLPGEITDPYEVAVRQSSMRPEFYPLAIANRYTIPSYFVLEKLEANGSLTPAELEDYFLQLGWPPELAAKAAAQAASAGSGSGKNPTAAQIAAPYVAGLVDRPKLLAELEAFGYSSDGAATYVEALDAAPVATARVAVLTKLHTAFVKGALTDEQAQASLAATTYPAATQAGILHNWRLEAAIVQLEGTSGTAPAV